MKRAAVAFVAIISLLVGGVWFGATTHAAGFTIANDNGDAVISADKTVDGSAYMAGNNVVVEGTVKGDLYCAGKTITIKGNVEGDVLCAGMTLTVGGTVNGDVRLAGSEVNVEGKVQGSVTAAGASLKLSKDAVVGRDVTAGGNDMQINGAVGRDVMSGSDALRISGTVGRDVTAGVNSLTVSDGAKITGNLNYTGEKSGAVANGTVQGKVNFTQAENERGDKGFDVLAAFVGLLALVVFTVLAVLLMPRFIHTAASLSLRNVLLAALLGLAFVVLMPVLAIVLFATGFGALTGFVLLVAYVLIGLASFVFASYYTGLTVLRKRATNAIVVAAVGALVLGILLMIPVLNVLVFIAAVLVGIGMPIMHLRYQFSKRPYQIVG